MAAFSKMLKTGMVVALLLTGVATGARGQSGGGGGMTGVGGGGRQVLRITGKVVCVNCSLDEVHKAQPNLGRLYQFTHRDGQAVVEVNMVNDSVRWSTLTWPPQLWVRAEDEVFQRLIAEKNLSKEIEITGLLSNSRTLDMFDVAVRG